MFPLTRTNEAIKLEGFHNIYYFEFGKFHYHSPEKHPFWEMVYVDKGTILANTDGNICTLEEGQAIFHCPGQIHSHVSNKEVANNLLVVSFSCHSDCMDFFSGKIFNLDKTGRMLLSLFTNEAKNALGNIPGDFFDKSALEFSGEKFGASQLMAIYFTELLVRLVRDGADSVPYYNVGTHPGYGNELVDAITEYLKENIYGDITLSDVCNRFFIRKSHLSVLFKEYTGMSTMSFYKKLKIEESKKMLREQNMSVSQICDRLSYSSIHNFTRAFKNATGFSPTGYKKSVMYTE